MRPTISIDLSKLTPAPWFHGTVYRQCTLSHEHGKGNCEYRANRIVPGGNNVLANLPPIGSEKEPITVAGMWDYEEGGIQEEVDAEFVVLARNAFDVMMRRGCGIMNILTAIFALATHNERREFVAFIQSLGDVDPFTALVEAEKWLKEKEAMSDTSKMSAEEYKAFTDAKATGKEPYVEIAERPMFKDFEIVECMIEGDWRRVKLLARHEKYIWVLWDKRHQPIELMADNMRVPNAEPETQKCPNCQNCRPLVDAMNFVKCTYCGLQSPVKPTRLEAIQAWNSIRVHLKKSDWVVGADDADSEPLTEEWVQKVELNKFGPDHWRLLCRPTSSGDWWIDTKDRTVFVRTALKTIGDARQLCRLLGVQIKE